MPKLQKNQNGALNVLLFPFIFVALLFIVAASFGAWAFSSRQDFKNNSDQKVTAAVTIAKQQTTQADAKQAALAAEQPLKPYTGPESYGSVIIKYPKTWSAYVSEAEGGGSIPLDGFFQPDFVSSITKQTTAFALRLQVVQQTYDQVLTQFSALTKQGTVTISPFKPANVPSVVGVRIDGQIAQNKQGSMIILPLRDKTFKLWTESDQFKADFNNNILPNFSFSP